MLWLKWDVTGRVRFWFPQSIWTSARWQPAPEQALWNCRGLASAGIEQDLCYSCCILRKTRAWTLLNWVQRRWDEEWNSLTDELRGMLASPFADLKNLHALRASSYQRTYSCTLCCAWIWPNLCLTHLLNSTKSFWACSLHPWWSETTGLLFAVSKNQYPKFTLLCNVLPALSFSSERVITVLGEMG